LVKTSQGRLPVLNRWVTFVVASMTLLGQTLALAALCACAPLGEGAIDPALGAGPSCHEVGNPSEPRLTNLDDGCCGQSHDLRAVFKKQGPFLDRWSATSPGFNSPTSMTTMAAWLESRFVEPPGRSAPQIPRPPLRV